MIAILLLSGIGFAVSYYAFYIEQKIKKDPSYKPACDLSAGVSCTKPIRSTYANMLGISNALVGIVYYVIAAVFAIFDFQRVLLLLTFVGLVATLGLAYILYFRIKSFCVLCTAAYIINILLFIASFRALK